MGLNRYIDRLLEGRNARKTANVVDFCTSALLQGENLSILDLGCGNGLFTHALSALPAVTNVIGVDVIDYRKVPIDFCLYNEGNTIPFGDNSFDYTFVVEVLHHSDDPERLLREAIRVTRGHIVLFEDVVTGPIRLFFMRGFDILVNIRHKVNIPLNFKSENGWKSLFAKLGLTIEATYDYNFYTMPTPQHCRVFMLKKRQ
jgi:SAM-dependent methyltransferase